MGPEKGQRGTRKDANWHVCPVQSLTVAKPASGAETPSISRNAAPAKHLLHDSPVTWVPAGVPKTEIRLGSPAIARVGGIALRLPLRHKAIGECARKKSSPRFRAIAWPESALLALVCRKIRQFWRAPNGISAGKKPRVAT